MKADVMAPLALLRPTQITVGLFQVQAKMHLAERLNASERARLMAKHLRILQKCGKIEKRCQSHCFEKDVMAVIGWLATG